MLRYGLEILGASLGPELHVCRKLDLDRMVEEVMGWAGYFFMDLIGDQTPG